MVFSFTDVYKKNFQLKHSVVLVKGSEPVLIDEVVRKLIVYAHQNHGSTETIETIDSDEVTAGGLSNCLNTLSFFSEKRIVILKKAGEIAFEAKKVLVTYLANPSTDILLILTLPPVEKSNRKEKKTAGKKQESIKEFEKKITTKSDVIECSFRPKEAFQEWVKQEAEKYGKKMSPATLLHFIEYIGSNASLVPMELKKLSTFCAERNTITDDDINALVVPHFESSIWMLIDAVCAKKTKNALELLERMFDQKQEPTYILNMLSRQFKLLLQAKAVRGYGIKQYGMDKEEAAQADFILPAKDNFLKINPFAQSKVMQVEKNMTLREIEQSLIRIHDVDLSLKGAGHPMDRNLALELLIVSLCERKNKNDKRQFNSV